MYKISFYKFNSPAPLFSLRIFCEITILQTPALSFCKSSHYTSRTNSAFLGSPPRRRKKWSVLNKIVVQERAFWEACQNSDSAWQADFLAIFLRSQASLSGVQVFAVVVQRNATGERVFAVTSKDIMYKISFYSMTVIIVQPHHSPLALRL